MVELVKVEVSIVLTSGKTKVSKYEFDLGDYYAWIATIVDVPKILGKGSIVVLYDNCHFGVAKLSFPVNKSRKIIIQEVSNLIQKVREQIVAKTLNSLNVK